MHFVMHAFNNHVEVLHNVTPFVLLQQMAVLSDGVVVVVLHQQFPSCGGVAGEARRGGCRGSAPTNSPPVEGWRAKPDRVVFCVPTKFKKTVGAE